MRIFIKEISHKRHKKHKTIRTHRFVPFVAYFLVSTKLERGFGGAVIPRAGNRTVVRPDVIQFSVSNEVGGLTFVVFAVGFHVHSPLG